MRIEVKRLGNEIDVKIDRLEKWAAEVETQVGKAKELLEKNVEL